MIETLIKQIAEKIPPSSGGNLDGFFTDLDYALCNAKDIISAHKISITKDPYNLILVKAIGADDVTNLPDITRSLKNLWASVTYRYFEASSYAWYKEGIVLRFITVVTDEQFFVSGAIIVQGKKCQKLVSEHQQKIGRSYDSLHQWYRLKIIYKSPYGLSYMFMAKVLIGKTPPNTACTWRVGRFACAIYKPFAHAWLQAFPTSQAESTPAHMPVTQTVGRFTQYKFQKVWMIIVWL